MSKIVKCIRCGKDFEDVNYIPSLPLAVRVYCNGCVDRIWDHYKNSNKKKMYEAMGKIANPKKKTWLELYWARQRKITKEIFGE